MAKYVEKTEQSAGLIGKVFDSFKSDSHTDTVSIYAIRNVISNPNLLINPDFQVWQRGVSFQNALNRGYTCDRWKVFIEGENQDTINVQENNGRMMTSGKGKRYIIHQLIELNNSIINKMKKESEMSASLCVVSSKEIQLASYLKLLHKTDISKDIYLGQKTDIKTIPNNSIVVNYECSIPENIDFSMYSSLQFILCNVPPEYSSADNMLYFYWSKVEFGEIATPFVPRLYSEELALCQRYGIRGLLQGDCLYRSMVNGSDMYFYLPTPVTLRTNPTFIVDLAGTGNIAIRKKSDNTHIPVKSISCTADTNEIQAFCTLNSNVNGNPWEFMMYVHGFFDAEIY